jgi:hypothetical protein
MTAINRHISTPEQVAALANEPEGPTIDYKGDADPAEWWELAKDIAAFANHLGGVIIVGAYEPNGLPSIRGLPPEKASALANAYENVAKERCRPSPLVTCEKIPWSDGREVLAVNVQAHASGLVGARFYALNTKGEKVAANAWQFVMRVGKHNQELPLEQAIMHMSPHARRIAILLEGIPTSAHIKLALRRPAEKGLHVPVTATLTRFSVESNTADFHLSSGFNENAHGVPLDDIEAVWIDASIWCIRIAGYFQNWSDNGGGRPGAGVARTAYIACPRSEG